MPPRIVISVDGLNARFLGAYGNNWVPTPAIDAFAARGLVFDHFYAEHQRPDVLLDAKLTGLHPLWPESTGSIQPARPSDSNQERILITDSHQLSQKVQDRFDGYLETAQSGVEESNSENGTSPSGLQKVFETAFAEIDHSQMWHSEKLVWIHCRGMFGNWDAPIEFQDVFKGDEDPLGIQPQASPALLLDRDHDPDERVRWQHAYAAQVMQLDQVLGDFLSVVWEKQPEMAVTFCGLRGFALGEHLEIGDLSRSLHVEKTHVPLIHVDHRDAPVRLAALLGTHSFNKLFCQQDSKTELQRLLVEDQTRESPTVLISASDSHARLQTNGWSFVQPLDLQEQNHGAGQLYRMPDDRLEMNDVAELCPEIVEELQVELARQIDAYSNQVEPEWIALSDQAFYGID